MIFGKTGVYSGGFSSGDTINGVAFYVEATRPDAAPINATVNTGDRWYNTTDNTEWFWNGTYWLSPPITSGVMIAQGGFSNNFATDGDNSDLFIHSVLWVGKVGASNDASNYKRLQLTKFDSDGVNASLAILADTTSLPANDSFAQKISANFFISRNQFTNSVSPAVLNYYVRVDVVGSPGTTWAGTSIVWSKVFK